jgi:hypothetical protein
MASTKLNVLHAARATTMRAMDSHGVAHLVVKVELPTPGAVGRFQLPQYRLDDGRLLLPTADRQKFVVGPAMFLVEESQTPDEDGQMAAGRSS